MRSITTGEMSQTRNDQMIVAPTPSPSAGTRAMSPSETASPITVANTNPQRNVSVTIDARMVLPFMVLRLSKKAPHHVLDCPLSHTFPYTHGMHRFRYSGCLKLG